MSKIVRYDQLFIEELILNSFNISGARIRAFTGNTANLANKINVNKNLFFGDLTINIRAFLVKNQNFFNVGLPSDIFASLLSVPQLLLASQLNPSGYVSNDVSHYSNLLFDDIMVPLPVSWLGESVNASLSTMAEVPVSYSNLVPGNKNYIPGYWAGAIAAFPEFIFKPEFLYFSGYLISIDI